MGLASAVDAVIVRRGQQRTPTSAMITAAVVAPTPEILSRLATGSPAVTAGLTSGCHGAAPPSGP
jgi:hypothetical protein